MGYSPWGRKESDMTERLHFHFSLACIGEGSGNLLGAGVRHSAHGKGHEEGGSTYAKAGSSLRSPPGNPRASTPITRACLLYYFVLTYTSDFTGGCPPPPLLEKELT